MTNRSPLRLAVVAMESSVFVAVAYLVVGIFVSHLGHLSSRWEWIAATAVLAPAELAAWWVYSRLKSKYSRRGARAAALALAICAPIALFAAFLFGQLIGGFVSSALGNRFEFWSASGGFALSLCAVEYALMSLALSITNRADQAEARGQ